MSLHSFFTSLHCCISSLTRSSAPFMIKVRKVCFWYTEYNSKSFYLKSLHLLKSICIFYKMLQFSLSCCLGHSSIKCLSRVTENRTPQMGKIVSWPPNKHQMCIFVQMPMEVLQNYSSKSNKHLFFFSYFKKGEWWMFMKESTRNQNLCNTWKKYIRKFSLYNTPQLWPWLLL